MSLVEWGSKIAGAALQIQDIPNGPWAGSMEDKSADRVPRTHAVATGVTSTGSHDFLYQPHNGAWKRRSGQTQKFDTFGSAAGNLPALWLSSATSLYCKARQLEEFISDSVTDRVPTVCALVTKETIASGLDDGYFSNFWWRDQVALVNRTIGSEYSATFYPAVGSAQAFRVVPLWYESGDGGITRGTTEFLRRFFCSGSRRFLKVGNWWYFPNLKGTPCRWNGNKSTVAAAAGEPLLKASGDSTPLEWTGGHADIFTDDSDTTFIFTEQGGALTRSSRFTLNGTIDASLMSWTVNLRLRSTGSSDPAGTLVVELVRSDGQAFTSSMALSEFMTTYSSEALTSWSAGSSGQTANSIKFTLTTTAGFPATAYRITYAEVVQVSSATPDISCRLIPSGPIPPTHAGSLARGTLATGESVSQTSNPDADISAGTFTGSGGGTLFSKIDETAADDLDYIQSSAGSITSCDISMATLGVTPATDSSVRINFRARRNSGSNNSGQLSVYLVDGATIRATYTTLLTSEVTNYSYQLSNSEISSVSAWTNLTLRFATEPAPITGIASDFYAQITWANITYAPNPALAEGSWFGHDRFLYSVAYRFEDGSIWMPCTPRLPQASGLTEGFNMFTVNEASPDAQYDFITWSNIPIGPHGTVGRLLLRSPKVDSSITGDELKLNPFDLRLVWELTDNTTTTYVDYQSDDFGLAEDPSGLLIRYDHIMPPRSRYIAGGDMRVVHAYGGQNPCAIVIAPVGRAADYDLNLADTSSTAYTSQGSWMRYRIETDGNATLRLVQGDGATATNSTTLDMDDYATLQALVDKINATSFSVDGQQWRAQLCPGANPAAPSKTALTPHAREIASVVAANGSATLTKASGGLSVVAVGSLISATGITVGTYVSRIDSDTQLTMSANAGVGAGTNTTTFYTELGDVAITGELGWQRVIANSLPGFLYFNESYLDDDPVDKSSVWMTTASPGSMRSAANNFSGKLANRFKPPSNAGISMGGAAVDQGFVLPFSGGVYALKNTRDAGTGVDDDYKLVSLNETDGCVAWNTVTPGNQFVPYLKAGGLYAANLEREVKLSDDIFTQTPATGSLSYEIPLSVAATAADSDTSYAYCKVMRSAIWLNYRISTSTTHPNRQVVLDFSAGDAASGLGSLYRTQPLLDPQTGRVVAPSGTLFGWSTPLVRSVTAMCEARRDDGNHLYGWNDLNAGTAGGRIDEIETSDTDNGTAISAEVRFPWERLGKHTKLSAQEIVIEHKAPAGATVLLDFHRSYSDSTSTLTPSPTSLDVSREVKLLPQAARAVTAACFVGYRQTAGGAAELRAFTLRAKAVSSYT